MQWPHCEQREGLSARSISQCKSPLLVRRVRAPALEPLRPRDADQVGQKSQRRTQSPLCSHGAAQSRSSRVRSTRSACPRARSSGMWRLDIDTSRPPKAHTYCHRDSTRAAAGEVSKRLGRTDPGCKELDQGERAVSNKVVKGRLCEVDHVGSRHGGDGSEAGKEGGGAHLLCKVRAGCQFSPSARLCKCKLTSAGVGGASPRRNFAAARRGIQRVRRVNLFSLSTWQYCKFYQVYICRRYMSTGRDWVGTFPRESEFPHEQTQDTMYIAYLVTLRQLSNSYVLLFTRSASRQVYTWP